MGTITPTSPTFTSLQAPVVLASGGTFTVVQLDLKAAFGAWVICNIGRGTSTALSVAAEVNIRRTFNQNRVLPQSPLDVKSLTTAATSNTLSAGSAIGATTISVTSATGFSVGDVICLSPATAARMQWAKIFAISGTTFTLEEPLKTAVNSGDGITNQGESISVWVPGGDVYNIFPENKTGVSIGFEILAEVFVSETTA